MSLINDALKRANAGKPDGSGDSGRPLQPVHHRGGSSKSPLLLAALFFMIACGCWFLYQATTIDNHASEKPVLRPPAEPPVQSNTPPQTETQTPVTTPSPKSTIAGAAAEPSPEPRVETPVSQSTPATPPPVVPVVPQATIPEPPGFPELKLTGIIYHRTSPSVIVNGKSLFVGESILGARLTEVTPTAATFEFDGEKKTLAMP